MFDIDKWQEIFLTIIKNPLRTFLTAFSVAWGIFMLVILLGFGTGLENWITYQFRDGAINALYINPGQTSQPFKGLQPGRNIRFTNEDYDMVKHRIEGVEYITGRFYPGGTMNIVYKKEYGSFNIRCVHPDHQFLENTIILKGRYINEHDMQEYRKVAVLGELVVEALFGEEDPIGKYIKVNSFAFKVVGVFKDEGEEGETEIIYLPISTAQRVFNGANIINRMMLTVGDASLEESKQIERSILELMASKHTFSQTDEKAIRIFSTLENYERNMSIIRGMRLFIWVIGVGTLLAGVVGVSNIMMIIVKERTKEFGIRKAIGATPWSIISLILQEAIFITGVAGSLGLFAGVGLLELLSHVLPEDMEFLRNPSVNISIAIQAMILLVIAGALAGLIPALRGASIRPIEALRQE